MVAHGKQVCVGTKMQRYYELLMGFTILGQLETRMTCESRRQRAVLLAPIRSLRCTKGSSTFGCIEDRRCHGVALPTAVAMPCCQVTAVCDADLCADVMSVVMAGATKRCRNLRRGTLLSAFLANLKRMPKAAYLVPFTCIDVHFPR